MPPDTLLLSAATQVAFRPSTRQTYTDELELVTGSGGSIIVPLSAVLPASKLQVPPAVDFGCVPVRQGCVQQLPITNVGDAGLLFSWKLQQPFAVVPATGQLGPGQTLVCEVSMDDSAVPLAGRKQLWQLPHHTCRSVGAVCSKASKAAAVAVLQ